ncbi:retroviral-like aspartic protease family protein [Candidatus Dojkabacteria bacterium]|nr:retroviral-like aspartic protease family protein [Candidatus Dojkabacteria bacterium]
MHKVNNNPFFAFTTNYSSISNILFNTIKVNTPILEKNPVNIHEGTEVKAIWDTGATNSVISSKVVKMLDLKPVSKVFVNTANGKTEQYVYYVSMFLPNKVLIPLVKVTECSDISDNEFDMLIGMDVINQGDLAISNLNGITKFSFRIPSMKEIDFVETAGIIRKQMIKKVDKEAKRKERKKNRKNKKTKKKKK